MLVGTVQTGLLEITDTLHLGHTVDHPGDRLAVPGTDVIERDIRILDHVMQDGCHQRVGIQVQAEQDLHHRQRVQVVRLARGPQLAVVGIPGQLYGTGQ